jgi:hypothetical protein
MNKTKDALMKEIEPFVDGNRAAEFLCVTRRRVLEMARANEVPAHPIGWGKRKTWRFRLSELAQAVAAEKPEALTSRRGIINTGSPRQPNRRN